MTMNLPSDLSVSTYGKKHHRVKSRKGKGRDKKRERTASEEFAALNAHDRRLKETTDLVLADLDLDSRFFRDDSNKNEIPPSPSSASSASRQHVLPSFTGSEVKFGDVLGEGEFGTVLEVAAFSLAPVKSKEEQIQRPEVPQRPDTEKQAERPEVPQPPRKGSDGGELDTAPETEALDVPLPPPLELFTSADKKEGLYSPSPKRSPNLPRSIFIKPGAGHSRGKSTGSVKFREKEEEMAHKSEPFRHFMPKVVHVESSTATEDTHEVMAGDASDVTGYSSVDPDDDDDEDDVGYGYNDAHEVMALKKKMMARRCQRNNLSRYAVKRVRKSIVNDSRTQTDAVIDMACEAKFLANIMHPNIVKLRGTVGTPGLKSFMLILDRLTLTLGEKMAQWKVDQRKYRGFFGVVGRDNGALQALSMQRLVAAFDIARALRYLHENKILYRDIKPDNIGLDVRGNVRIFDFGLAKELKRKDLVNPPDGYEATGLTGSRRYMAPEVVRCLPYGFSADVYAFAILFWQVMALRTPFDDYTAELHAELVVHGGRRPNARLAGSASDSGSVMSKGLDRMMQDSWNVNPRKRPTMKNVCLQIQAEILAHGGVAGSTLNMSDRSAYLQRSSFVSQYGNLMEGEQQAVQERA